MKAFGISYLNKADKSDPLNVLRVFYVKAFYRYVMIRWQWPQIDFGDVRSPVTPKPQPPEFRWYDKEGHEYIRRQIWVDSRVVE
jgi:hypothetical protein